MTSKIVVNNIEADAGVSTVTFGSDISGNFVGSISVSGVTTVAAGNTSAPSISPTGDSNTGIFFPSADTIAVATQGSEKIRVGAGGSINIGSTDTTYRLQVTSGSANNNDFGILHIRDSRTLSGAAGTGGIFLSSSPGTDYYIAKGYDGSSTKLVFGNGNTGAEFMKVADSGNVSISNGNLVFSTSGKGIDFSATANSSGTTTSELLADYEEGTWTPTWVPSAGSITNSYGSGKYIKIGDMVTLWGYYGYSTSSGVSAGDTIQLGGFPFSTPSSTFGQAQTGIALVHGQYGWNTVPEQTVQLSASSTSTSSLLRKNSTYSPGGTSLTFSDLQTSSNYSQIVFWASYRVT